MRVLALLIYRKVHRRVRLVSYPESRYSHYKTLAQFGIDLLTARLVDRLTLVVEGVV